jgi:secreted PhoX family phosphatase
VIGGTPLDRPEDIEQDPITKDIFVALTNNIPKGRPHGSLLRISESGANPLSMEFDYKTWMAGGPESGISSPDNLAFDKNGNLWVTTDRSLNPALKETYQGFGNNALFFIPMRGPNAGTPIQVASAPVGAEFTGPCFLPGCEALILSVQHPGEGTKDLDNLTSDWPDRNKKPPRSSVIIVRGPQFLKCVNT